MTLLLSLVTNIGLATMGVMPVPLEWFGELDSAESAMLQSPGTWICSTKTGQGGTIAAGDIAVLDCTIIDESGNVVIDTDRSGVPLSVKFGSIGLWNTVLFQASQKEERFAVLGPEIHPSFRSDVTVQIRVRQIIRSKHLLARSRQR